MHRVIVSVGALACLVATGGPAAAAGSECTAAQYKATGDYAKRVATCHSKAVKRGSPVDALCVAKALSKLQTASAKAESKADCLGASTPDELQHAADQGLEEVAAIVEPPAGLCCTSGPACFWVADSAACTAVGATPGAAGSVCRSDGSCGAPSAGLGPCCDGVTSVSGSCASGGLLNLTACSTLGTAFDPAASCRADRQCHD